MKIIGPLTVVGLMAMLLTGGCASMKQDLLKKEAVRLETVPVEDVTYLYTNVWQEGVKTYMSGRVALKDPSTARNAPAHLDISIYTADGKPLLIYYTPYKQYHHTGRRNQVQYFAAARLQMPEGSRVLLKHHFAEMVIHDRNDSDAG